MEFTEIALRVAFTFFALLFLARLMGKKEVSHVTFFNFISGIAIGELAAQVVLSKDLTLGKGVFALAGWSALTVLMGYLTMKSVKARTLIDGKPSIIVKDGELVVKELKKVRLDVDTVKSLLRTKSAFSMKDIDYAILEPNGELSVMKKPEAEPVTRHDMQITGIKKKVFPIPTEVITDGKIVNANLKQLHVDEAWLKAQLKEIGITSISDIFYAELQTDGTLYISPRKG
jgi:uncharacterized membrane protein YcaP (DUF421 family)